MAPPDRTHRPLGTVATCWLVCASLALSGAAAAAEPADPVTQLKAGMPTPVAALIERMVQCQHWAGEEPYDNARRAEIARAVRRLRCESIEQDERRLLKAHASNPEVRQRLEAARSGDW